MAWMAPPRSARIVILDTGIGMSTAYLAHIFGPFSREQDSRVDKTEGSGLRMAITRRLVELLAAALRWTAGRARAVPLRLSSPCRLTTRRPSPTHFPDLHILVVDDGAVTREYMDNASGTSASMPTALTAATARWRWPGRSHLAGGITTPLF